MSPLRTFKFWRRWIERVAWVALLWLAWPTLWPHLKAALGIHMHDALHPSFVVHTLNGDSTSLASLRGHVVLVNVWATWCLPCRAEMPLLESMWKRHRDAGLVILGASVDHGTAATVSDFVTARGITYPIAIVNDDVLTALGGVRGYPTSFLIGRDGTVLHKVIGALGPLSLEPAVRRALADSSTKIVQRTNITP